MSAPPSPTRAPLADPYAQERASVWVGLPGQEQWLHEAAQRFVNAEGGDAKAAEMATIEGGEKSATSTYYLKVSHKRW